MFYDYWYFAFMIPGLIIAMIAQAKLSSAYARYVRVPVSTGLSGAEAAREILDSAGLRDMPVNEVPGHLTDHYDPIRKGLFLSSENYHGRSLAAVGVAAHEAGHALQHKAAYAPLHLRMALVPVTNIATQAAMIFSIVGVFLAFTKLIWIGVAAYGVITLFQLITLPVEYDASRRAKAQLLRLGLVQQQESGGVSKVLNAAALTYVAAMVTSLLHLLYFLSIARNQRS